MVESEISNNNSKSRKWLWIVILVIIAGVGAYAVINRTSVSSDPIVEIPTTIAVEGQSWWDNDFSRRLKLTVDSSSPNNHFEVDHADLVKKKLSRKDATDIKVISIRGDVVEVLPTQISKPNSSQTKITFPVNKSADSFFAYYGNPEAESSDELPNDTSESTPVTNQEKQLPEFVADRTKDWALLDNGQIIAGIDFTGNFEQTYAVNPKDNQVIELEINESEVLLKGELPIGLSEVFFVTTEGETAIRSNSVRLNVSHPLYVAWTIDWEGNDVRDWVLDTMDAISAKNGIPMTHFFNPRIYVDKEMDIFRQDELTNYVKARQSLNGDEIAMHMHMYYDMIEAAGLEPKATPRWGSGLDGYDVLSSGYNYEEFAQLLDWALDTFAEHNLPTPKGYRAGGWFADLEILKAVADAGFTYDSSGRTEYKFGSRLIPGHWDLSTTTQPYFPSTTDQNVEGNNNLSLLEIPNNGNDSYWFTLEELLERFSDNYPIPGKTLTETTLITYLSHPDWFEVDQPKLESLFKEISKYKFEDDNGPVVYTTLQDTLPDNK